MALSTSKQILCGWKPATPRQYLPCGQIKWSSKQEQFFQGVWVGSDMAKRALLFARRGQTFPQPSPWKVLWDIRGPAQLHRHLNVLCQKWKEIHLQNRICICKYSTVNSKENTVKNTLRTTLHSSIYAISTRKETTGIIAGRGTGMCPGQVLPALGTPDTQLTPQVLCSIGEDFYTGYNKDAHWNTSPVR